VASDDTRLRQGFDEAMLQIYNRARSECKYNATRFLRMLHEHGGIETARRLLPSISDGYAELWKRGRLDLTVEALILVEPWVALFSESERQTARNRLVDSGYSVPMATNSAQVANPPPIPAERESKAPVRDVVGTALDLVASALRPFVERRMHHVHGDRWLDIARASVRGTRGETQDFDAAALFAIIQNNWQSVFRSDLDQAARAYVSELRETRNRWAHQESFTDDDTLRALDTSYRLLRAVSATDASDKIAGLKRQIVGSRG